MDLFAACLPGLEPLLADELLALGIAGPRTIAGGATFRGNARTVLRANLQCGIATHVLVRVGEFDVRALPELVRKVAAIHWNGWLHAGRPVAVRVRSKRSRLYHTGAIEQRVREGIAKTLGKPCSAPSEEDDTPRAELLVRLDRDSCSLSLDTSGAPLHRRGWRLAAAKAPLREDIARALLVASGWDRESPLVDPFAGSGTILIEAAGLARGLPAGRLRRFAFEDTPLFETALWDEVRAAAWERALDAAPGPIVGSDRDEGAVVAAGENAERAGVANDIDVRGAPMSDAAYLSGEPEAPPAGWVVSNPPHGRRVGKADQLRSLYQSLGTRLGALPDGWRTALLVADRQLAFATGVKLRSAFLTDHGGVKVRAMVSGGASPSDDEGA